MKPSLQHKPRLLWLAFKLLDKSENRIVLFQMLRLLNERFDGQLMGGYRSAPLPIAIAGRPVEYYNRSGRIPLNIVRAFFSQRRQVHRLFGEVRPQIVFLSHGPSLSMMRRVLRNADQACAPLVFDVRTLPTTDSNAPAFRNFGSRLSFAADRFAGVTYITEEMRRYCVERFDLPEHRSAIWTSGVNAEAFRPDAASTSNGALRLIYHGGIISVSRGLDRLVQAMDQVRDLDVHLTLISSLREPEAIGWIDRLNLRDRVKLVDTIAHADVPAAIQRHDAGILPFPSCDIWNTSSPIKLFEYMACGKPVVVTDIPAHRNVLDGRPFAFFADDATPEALAGAIRRAHAARASFPETGDQARRLVLEQHTWERQAEALGGFLMSLLAERQKIKP